MLEALEEEGDINERKVISVSGGCVQEQTKVRKKGRVGLGLVWLFACFFKFFLVECCL